MRLLELTPNTNSRCYFDAILELLPPSSTAISSGYLDPMIKRGAYDECQSFNSTLDTNLVSKLSALLSQDTSKYFILTMCSAKPCQHGLLQGFEMW